MNLTLHFLPEKPERSCEVITYHLNPYTGNLYAVMNCGYSKRHDLFNCCDFFSEENAELSIPYNKNIVAWSYLDEADGELHDEILG